MSNANVTPIEKSVDSVVKVVQFSRSPKASLLAVAKVEIAFGDDVVTVDDVRVLRNRQGQLWCALPAYSVQSANRTYEYFPTVTLSRSLARQLEDAVLAGFEKWNASQGENSNEKR